MNDSTRSKCLDVLLSSELAMLEILESVSQEDFMQKESPDLWSIAEIIDHVVQIETTVVTTLQNLPPTETKNQESMSNERVMELSEDRTLKSKAPEAFLPKGAYNDKSSAVQAFRMARINTIDFVKSTALELTAITFPHPRIGVMNGENWLTFIAGHCLKHVAQIKERVDS